MTVVLLQGVWWVTWDELPSKAQIHHLGKQWKQCIGSKQGLFRNEKRPEPAPRLRGATAAYLCYAAVPGFVPVLFLGGTHWKAAWPVAQRAVGLVSLTAAGMLAAMSGCCDVRHPEAGAGSSPL